MDPLLLGWKPDVHLGPLGRLELSLHLQILLRSVGLRRHRVEKGQRWTRCLMAARESDAQTWQCWRQRVRLEEAEAMIEGRGQAESGECHYSPNLRKK